MITERRVPIGQQKPRPNGQHDDAHDGLNEHDGGDATRILLVDDHPVTREGLVGLLKRLGFVVSGEAECAASALQAIERSRPDLAIVDISLNNSSGIELTREISSRFPGLPVLILSMHDETLYAERALRAGARGYVMKSEASDRIGQAVYQIMHGETYLSEQMREPQRIEETRRDGPSAPFSVDALSDREIEVLRLIGNGFSTREIAEQLRLSVKTVDSHRERLKKKLRLTCGRDLVQQAIRWVRSEQLC